MKRMRLHLIIATCIFVILLIVGYFFDLDLSNAIAAKENNFAIAVSVFGMVMGYTVTSFISGFAIYEILKDKIKIVWRILFAGLSVALFILAITNLSSNLFGINGYYGLLPVWVGYFLFAPLIVFFNYVGYKIYSKATVESRIALILVSSIMCIVILLAGGVLIKLFFHRPRYRAISEYGVPFYKPFEICKNYKELMSTYGIDKDNFKSFPSGHTATSLVFACSMIFAPLVNKKYEKDQVKLFYIGIALSLFVGYARILVGAHFISDIAFGGIIALVCGLITNEVLIRSKLIKE